MVRTTISAIDADGLAEVRPPVLHQMRRPKRLSSVRPSLLTLP
jgi:hypothetical protein